jgi:predicted transcriptional regulator of viral defense system
MQTNLRTLGAHETQVVLSFREQGREVVRTADVIDVLGSEQSARKVIRNLVRKGWLARLVGGRYMLLPPEHGPENIGEQNVLALASATIHPSYVGWWSAAAFHGFTTQKPLSLSVAVLRQAPARLIEGTDVRFVKVAQRKFFGFQDYAVYGRHASLSTPVKTLVDCIDRPDLCGGASELTRIVHSAMGDIDPDGLVEAALKMASISLLQRLGFLTDLVGKQLPESARHRLREAIPRSARSAFGRRKRKDGDIGYVSEWGLLVNARREDLLTEVPRIRSQKDN